VGEGQRAHHYIDAVIGYWQGTHVGVDEVDVGHLFAGPLR